MIVPNVSKKLNEKKNIVTMQELVSNNTKIPSNLLKKNSEPLTNSYRTQHQSPKPKAAISPKK